MKYTSPTQVFRVGYYPWETEYDKPILKVGDLVTIMPSDDGSKEWCFASRIDSDKVEFHGVMFHWLSEYRGTVL